jgi:hypothetical protein
VQRMATRLGAPGRLTDFSGGLQIFRAAPRILAFALEEASGSPNLRVRFRILRRLSEPGLAWKKVEAAPGSQARLSEDSGGLQNLRAAQRALRRALEPWGGSQNPGARSRRLGRCAESRNAPQILGASFRSLQRGAEGSRIPPYLGAQVRIFQGVPEPSVARFKIRGALRAFRVASGPSASRRSLRCRSGRFWRPLESSAPHPRIRRGAPFFDPAPQNYGEARNLRGGVRSFGQWPKSSKRRPFLPARSGSFAVPVSPAAVTLETRQVRQRSGRA